MISDRYTELKSIAIDTLKDFEGGVYFVSDDFTGYRNYPYPLLRWKIADELYRIPSTTMDMVGRIVGIKHSTIVYGFRQLDNITEGFGDAISTAIIKLFDKKRKEHDSQKASDKREIWGVDKFHFNLFRLITNDENKPLVTDGCFGWYQENDDLAQAIMTQ